jgi:predicted small lipoprotein YifL
MIFAGPCHRNETMKRCILCLAALLLAACGASGALYLPGHERPKSGLPGKERQKSGASQAAPATTPAQSAAPAPNSPSTPVSNVAPNPAPAATPPP